MPAAAKRIEERVIAEAKGRRLSDVVGKYVALRKAGNQFQGLCPFHKEASPSFFVSNSRGTFKCFGCGEQGDVIDFLTKHRGIDFQEAINELTSGASYRTSADVFMARQREAATEYAEAGGRRFDSDPEERSRLAEARAIWSNGQETKGTLAERYLRQRGIRARLPRCIRFAPKLYFGPARKEVPALIAALQDGFGQVCAVQRIYLDKETGGKAQPAKEAKRTKGPMRDGAVRLGRPGRVLGIAEGVETAMSAAQIYSLPVWASLGAQRMKSLWLPPEVEEIMIFRDNGEVGLKEAIAAAEIWEEQGRRVMIEPPPAEHSDWNDLLMAREGLR